MMGDLHRNVPDVPPLIQRWREDDYSWQGPRSWACFRPDVDVLVPMYYGSTPEDIVSPFEGARNISMLLRFAYQKGDGKNLVEHYGHRLRYELIEYWRAHPLEGSDQGLRSSAARSLLCSAPCMRGHRCPMRVPRACVSHWHSFGKVAVLGRLLLQKLKVQRRA